MHRRIVVVFALVAGCGRVGFDSQVSADASPGDAAACVPAIETCNGIDDDCNGVVDEGCACTAFDLVIQIVGSTYPGIEWTGTGYVVLTDDGATYGMQEITQEGVIGARGMLVAKAGATVFGPRPVAWNGRIAVVAWERDTHQVMVSAFDAHGAAIGPAMEVSPTTSAFEPSIARTRDGFVVVWTDSRDGNPVVYLRTLDTTGAPRGSELATAQPGTAGTIRATAAGYLVVVSTATNPTTVELAPDGSVLATHPPTYGTKGGTDTTLSLGGPVPAATWRVGSDFDCVVEVLGADGTASGMPVTLPTYNAHPILLDAVAGTPAGFTVFGLTFASPPEVVRVDFDPSLALIAGPTLLYAFDGNGFDEMQAIATDHRQTTLVPTVSPSQARLVQQCQ